MRSRSLECLPLSNNGNHSDPIAHTQVLEDARDALPAGKGVPGISFYRHEHSDIPEQDFHHANVFSFDRNEIISQYRTGP